MATSTRKGAGGGGRRKKKGPARRASQKVQRERRAAAQAAAEQVTPEEAAKRKRIAFRRGALFVKDVTQVGIADKLGLHESTVSRIMNESYDDATSIGQETQRRVQEYVAQVAELPFDRCWPTAVEPSVEPSAEPSVA